MLTLNIYHIFCTVSIVNFEHVIAGWVLKKGTEGMLIRLFIVFHGRFYLGCVCKLKNDITNSFSKSFI